MSPIRSHADEPRPGDVLSIDLDLLDDNPFQPRKQMDLTKLGELAASIRHSGLLQPIAVRPIAPGRYQVVAGHRRVAAFRMLRTEAKTEAERRPWELIRAHVVAAISDSEMAVAAYVENAQRDNLTLLDEAAALARIRELGGHSTSSQVAEATGQPERRVRRLLRLCTAPKVIRDFIARGVQVDVSASGEPPKSERRTLDLIAALEFIRLYEFHARNKPATADERTATAISRALTHGWGLRRIQTWVDGVLNGTPAADPITDTRQVAAARSVPPKDKGTDERGAHEPRNVCSSSSERFTLHLSRMKAASSEQLEAARTTIDDVRQLIEAQLQRRGRATGA